MDDAGGAIDSIDSLLVDAVCGLSSDSDHLARSSDDALPGIGSVIADRYLLEELLGRGGMGAVFAGRHVVTGKRVAIKLLRGDPLRHRQAALRMAREARAVGRIQHRNVVAVYDAGFAGDRPFIAMELLQGESLEQRIERTGCMSEAEAVSTLQQIAHGVAAAHANGIIHRDLKPANIFLCPRPKDDGSADLVKVLDFGISKLHGDGEEDVMVTALGVQVGTPAFMSPEQVRGDDLDARSDVYALCVLLHYTLTQRFPFHAKHRAELFAKILTEGPASLLAHRPGVSTAIAAVVMKGLARDRTHRYGSVMALADALNEAIIRRGGPPRRSVRGSRSALLLAAVSGIAVTVVPSPVRSPASPALPRITVANTQPLPLPLPLPATVLPLPPPVAVAASPMSTLASNDKETTPARSRKPTRVKTKSDTLADIPAAPDGDLVTEVKLMSW